MNVQSECDALFVDINETLYCSLGSNHQVVKRSLSDAKMTSVILVAGTGFEGSEFNELDQPHGIFVDVNFDLYVADYANNRIQLWPLGESSGITVAGKESANPTINLLQPTAVVLDAEKYLFIVDNGNNRIVGSGSNGFRCLVGCSEPNLSTDAENIPYGFNFDRCGNMFVSVYHVNNRTQRIQKFRHLDKSCGKLE